MRVKNVMEEVNVILHVTLSVVVSEQTTYDQASLVD